jgi:hypothetical protein
MRNMPWLPVAPVTRITFFILNLAFDVSSEDGVRKLRDGDTSSYMLIYVKPGDGRVLSYRNVSSVDRSCGGK